MVAGTLAETVTQVEAVVAGLEPGVLLASDAAEMVSTFARLERMAAAGKAICARRVAESRVWCRRGDKSPAHWLAATLGLDHRRRRWAVGLHGQARFPAVDG